MSRKTIGLVLGAIIAIIPWQDASTQNARPSTEQLVYRLTQAPPIEREATVAYLLTLDATQTASAIWRALASELKRLDELRRHRRALAQEGAVLDDFPAEYHALVIEVISRSQDPIVVSALVGSLDTGWMAVRAMAKFDAVEVVREILPIAEGQEAEWRHWRPERRRVAPCPCAGAQCVHARDGAGYDDARWQPCPRARRVGGGRGRRG